MMNTSEMIALQNFFNKATDDQMREIAQMFNDARSLSASRAARAFAVGQKVSWVGRRGNMEGTVVKVLKKNVRVKVSNGDMWNVTASRLKAA